MSQGIALLLLYPFIDLCGKTMPQLIKIKADYRQLIFSYPRNEALLKHAEPALANISARLIQRAYRQRLFQKQARPLEAFSRTLGQS